MKKWPGIHNEAGLEDCKSCAKRNGDCKNALRISFSQELFDKYSDTVGQFNKHGDRFYKGKQAYDKVTAEDFFYTSFNVSKHSNREVINDFLTK